MFDFDAGKLVVIGVVALIVIGPKDLPRVLRQVGQTVAKLRRMASEFQSQFMEAMREAELDDLRKDMAALNDVTKMRAFNPIDTVRRELTDAMTERPAAPALASPDTPASEALVASDLLSSPDPQSPPLHPAPEPVSTGGALPDFAPALPRSPNHAAGDDDFAPVHRSGGA